MKTLLCKKIFPLLINFFLISSIYSQSNEDHFYIIGGYNFLFPPADDLNYIIGRYNETRDYLTTEMGDIKSLSGPAFAVGYSISTGENAWILEGGITFNNSGTKSAKGVVQGQNAERDLKMKIFLVNLGFGYILNAGKQFEYGFGLYSNIGNIKIETRVYYDNQTVPDYTDITPAGSSTSVAFTPTIYLNLNFTRALAVSVRPFYSAQFLQHDLTDVNAAINPNTWTNDDPANFDSETFSGFGIELDGKISF